MNAIRDETQIRIYDAYKYKNTLREIPGRHFDALDKAWTLPLKIENIRILEMLGADIDDNLKEYIQENHLDNEEIKSLEPMPVNLKPYKHQIKGFNKCMINDGYGLLFDVGLGKSITAAAVAAARYKKGQIKKLLIVCPLSVMSVWEREFENITVSSSVHILEGTTIKRRDKLKSFSIFTLNVAVINYEGARIMLEDLLKWKAEMLIVDESQKIKNSKSKQSKVLHKLAKQSKYRIILTATPVGNSIADIYSQWKVIDENIFGNSFYSFCGKYIIMGGYKQRNVVGYKNINELLTKMHSKSLRITKEQALDLPKQVFETRYCQLESKAKAVYDNLKYQCCSELKGGEITANNILTKLLRLQQCADGFLKPDNNKFYQKVADAKLELLDETITEILSAGEKIVIFARFTQEIREIEKRISNKNISCLVLDGSIKNKGDIVKKFQEKKEIKILICQTQVGGVGITLTSASVVIFYSLTFSLIDYLQAIGRTHRIGQKTRCLYINLIAKNTIDEHILAAVEQKKNLSDNVCDNYKKYLK